jgi:glucan biosynthesis protein
MALRGWESWPRSNALISGDVMKWRYKASWNSDSAQKTTCSYLTGTTKNVRGQAESQNNITHNTWTKDRSSYG